MQRRISGDSLHLSSAQVIFTICASNYLAQAGVLGASVSNQHPGTSLYVFLLDEPPESVDLDPTITLVPAASVLSREEWNHRLCYYDTLEFATSVKPACFSHLFDQGVQRAIYLDPDIELFHRLDRFWDGDAAEVDLVLTPHMLTPLPDDGCQPDDLAILRAGQYNLGFAAIRNTPESRALLEWWNRKLHVHCLADVRTGVFTDQKWMEHAPLMVRACTVLRDLGYNVAYWNLHEREPRYVDGRWRVVSEDGSVQDLVFFHYSGFDPEGRRISRHENRFVWDLPGDTDRLLESYAQALDRHDWANLRQRGVPRAVLPDGAIWDAACRLAYRQALAEGLSLGDPLQDTRFLEWAGQRAPGDHLTRYTRSILQLNSALAVLFDDGRNGAGLMAWMRSAGVDDFGLDRMLIERFGPASDVEGRVAVNYVGYLSSHLGVAEAARNSIDALQVAGVSVRVHDISTSAPVPMGTYALPASASAEAASITVLGCNADMLPEVWSKLPADFQAPYRIGCWYWETPDFPEAWSDRFEMIDEVWVATEFVADAIRKKTDKPVVVMPPMVMPPPVTRDSSWLCQLLPDVTAEEFLFFFQFDVTSVPFRKNPQGAITAFCRAFRPDEPVRLIVKALNGDAAPALMESLRELAGDARITFFTEALESAERFRLLASVDCFVSLHRSEGFGLSIAEAMALGLPVVTTGWSGNADFTDAGNAALVPFDLVPCDQQHGPYTAGTIWAEPRIDTAAKLMRRVWSDLEWRTRIAQAGKQTVKTQYAAWRVGGAMRLRLEEIAASMRVQQARADAANEPSTPVEGGWKALIRDLVRYPGYYLSRMPRAPLHIWHSGVTGTIRKVHAVAASPHETKSRYLASRVFAHHGERREEKSSGARGEYSRDTVNVADKQKS